MNSSNTKTAVLPFLLYAGLAIASGWTIVSSGVNTVTINDFFPSGYYQTTYQCTSSCVVTPTGTGQFQYSVNSSQIGGTTAIIESRFHSYDDGGVGEDDQE